MKLVPSLLVASIVACVPCVAQDSPITATSASISVVGQFKSSKCSFAAYSVSYDVQNSSIINGGVFEYGKISFNPLTIVKPVDVCSANLLYAAAAGITIPEVLIIVSPVKIEQPKFVLRLGTVHVSQLRNAASSGTAIQEQVMLQYGDLTLAEVAVYPTRSLLSCHGWTILQNVADDTHCAEIEKVAGGSTF